MLLTGLTGSSVRRSGGGIPSRVPLVTPGLRTGAPLTRVGPRRRRVQEGRDGLSRATRVRLGSVPPLPLSPVSAL